MIMYLEDETHFLLYCSCYADMIYLLFEETCRVYEDFYLYSDDVILNCLMSKKSQELLN